MKVARVVIMSFAMIRTLPILLGACQNIHKKKLVCHDNDASGVATSCGLELGT